MSDEPPAATPRWGWLLATGVSALMTAGIAAGGIWTIWAARKAGAGGWSAFSGSGAGVLFWCWMTAGCWRRATSPEPDPYEPAPVPRSAAFVAANAALALLFTAMVAAGMWATVDSARTDERLDLVEHRVMVAAREVDLTVEDLRRLHAERVRWRPTGSDPDPAAELLPVEGAKVVDVAYGDDTASVLFRPDGGPPCVVLDIDPDGLLSTRRTDNCS